MNETKKWYTSKVVWINVITVASAIFALTSTQAWLPAWVPEVLAFSNGVLNILLRFLTNQPLELPRTVQAWNAKRQQ